MTLFPFQIEGVEYLRSRKRALLMDEMGLGKTVQALHAMPADRPIVVVCPALVKGVWKREAAIHRPDLQVTVLKGRASYRRPEPGEVVVVNPELLPEQAGWGLGSETHIVADEVHMFKSATAQRTKNFRHLVRGALGVGGSVWGLTGTPLLSYPPDLWGVLESLSSAADVFGRWAGFMAMFRAYRKRTHFGSEIVWRAPTPEVASRLRKFALGRNRADVLPQLPGKTYEEYEVELGARSFEVNEEEVGRALETGRVSPHMSAQRAALALDKAREARAYIEMLAAGGPVVVFSAHTEAAQAAVEGMDSGVILGETPAGRRGELVAEFQAGRLRVLAGTVGAMGVGVTLTASHRVVFIDRDWTPSLNAQAEDRVCRIGQTRGVIVTDVVSTNPIDRKVLAVLRRKQAIISASVDAARV